MIVEGHKYTHWWSTEPPELSSLLCENRLWACAHMNLYDIVNFPGRVHISPADWEPRFYPDEKITNVMTVPVDGLFVKTG